MNSEECLEKMNLKNSRSTYSSSDNGDYYYYLFEAPESLNGNDDYSAAVVARIKMYGWSSFRQICDVGNIHTKMAEGPSCATWHETDAGMEEDESDFPLTSVHFYGQGYFTVSVNVGNTAGVSLSGFSAGSSHGGTVTYTSEEMLMTPKYQAYR